MEYKNLIFIFRGYYDMLQMLPLVMTVLYFDLWIYTIMKQTLGKGHIARTCFVFFCVTFSKYQTKSLNKSLEWMYFFQVIHKHLAAKNVLLTKDKNSRLMAKVAGFGPAKGDRLEWMSKTSGVCNQRPTAK